MEMPMCRSRIESGAGGSEGWQAQAMGGARER